MHATAERASSGGTATANTVGVDSVGDYLRRIGRFPLLEASDEIRLARQIEVGLFAQERLDSREDLDPSAKRELATLAREGRTAYTWFVCCNLRLVVSVAKRYTGYGLAFIDLIQEGNLGLDRAVKKFDYTRGFKFSTYATWWIRQAVSRSLADSARLIRVPVHTAEKIRVLSRVRREFSVEFGREAKIEELVEETGFERATILRLLASEREPVSLQSVTGDSDAEIGEFLEDADALPISDIVWQTRRNDELWRRVEQLPRREAEILRFRYGLRETPPMTLAEVGATVGVSRERVRQLERNALSRLRCSELAEFVD